MDKWKKFIETYDFNYFNLSFTEKKEFQNFKGLKRIVNLYLSSPKINEYKLLTEIISVFYHISEQYNKKIYVFGEEIMILVIIVLLISKKKLMFMIL